MPEHLSVLLLISCKFRFLLGYFFHIHASTDFSFTPVSWALLKRHHHSATPSHLEFYHTSSIPDLLLFFSGSCHVQIHVAQVIVQMMTEMWCVFRKNLSSLPTSCFLLSSPNVSTTDFLALQSNNLLKQNGLSFFPFLSPFHLYDQYLCFFPSFKPQTKNFERFSWLEVKTVSSLSLFQNYCSNLILILISYIFYKTDIPNIFKRQFQQNSNIISSRCLLIITYLN